MLGILRIKFEAGFEQFAGDAFAQPPQRRPWRPALRHDFDIDVFRHALDHPVRAAQGRAALEDKPKWPGVGAAMAPSALTTSQSFSTSAGSGNPNSS